MLRNFGSRTTFNAMTATVIYITAIAWILLSAFFITLACVLSARMRRAGFSYDEDESEIRRQANGETPTTPVR